jgi:hypothetical protein
MSSARNRATRTLHPNLKERAMGQDEEEMDSLQSAYPETAILVVVLLVVIVACLAALFLHRFQ